MSLAIFSFTSAIPTLGHGKSRTSPNPGHVRRVGRQNDLAVEEKRDLRG